MEERTVYENRIGMLAATLALLLMSTAGLAQDTQSEPDLVGVVSGSWVDRDAWELVMKADETSLVRFRGVDYFKVTRHVRGIPGPGSVTEWYRVESVEHPSRPFKTLVPAQISNDEIARLEAMQQFGGTREELRAAFENASLASSMLGRLIQEESGLFQNDVYGNSWEEFEQFHLNPCVPYSEIEAARSDPNSVPQALRFGMSPAAWMLGPACYYQVMSTLFAEVPEDTAEQARRQVADRQAAAGNLRLAGTEQVGGARSHHLRLDGIELTQPVEGGSTTIHAISVWLDAEHLVRRKQRMEGVSRVDGEEKDFVLETEFDDFRSVPGSNMFEPYRQVLRFGGTMTPEQEAEAKRAAAELEKLEAQLAQMPAGQRAMMERMMGDQMEQIRSLAEGGTVEVEFITTNIEVNPENFGLSPDLGQPGGTIVVDDATLIRAIQSDLDTLGYEPGEINGVLTQPTAVAIVKFESENGMPVTGRPSIELADALAAAVASL